MFRSTPSATALALFLAAGSSALATKKPEEESAETANAGNFCKKVSYDSIDFTITSPVAKEGNQFTITSTGLTEVNDSFRVEIKGKVVDVLCDDMDGDNSPEVAVIIEGPNAKRTAQVFSAFNRKSFGMVNFVDVTNPEKLKGYRGDDEFQFVENSFIRRFPLYEGNAKTGKHRQFQFKMELGEAAKQLKLKRTSEF